MRIIQECDGYLQSYIPDLAGDDMGMPFRAHVSCNTRPKAWMFFNISVPIQSISRIAEIFGKGLVVNAENTSSLSQDSRQDSGDTSIGKTRGKIEDEGALDQHKIFQYRVNTIRNVIGTDNI
jgi:hypothetical protein